MRRRRHHLRVLSELIHAGCFSVAPGSYAHHVDIIGVDRWASIGHGVEVVVFAFLFIKVSHVRRRWTSAASRATAQVHLSLTKRQLLLTKHQLTLSHGNIRGLRAVSIASRPIRGIVEHEMTEFIKTVAFERRSPLHGRSTTTRRHARRAVESVSVLT